MTTKQFNAALNRLFRTQREAAEILGITAGAVSHYSTGRRVVPEIVARLMQCIEENRKHRGPSWVNGEPYDPEIHGPRYTVLD